MIDSLIKKEVEEILENITIVKDIFRKKTLVVTGIEGVLACCLCDELLELIAKVIGVFYFIT